MEIIDGRLIFKTHEKYVQLRIEGILFCISEGVYTSIFSEEDFSTTLCRNLKQIEDILNNFNFIRIHNSYYVNINRIDSFCSKNRTILIQGKSLPISKKRYKVVIKILLTNNIPDIKNHLPIYKI